MPIRPKCIPFLASALLLLFCLLPSSAQAQMPQQILFTPPAPQAFAGTSVVLTASASSGLPVTFTVVNGPGQVSGVNGSTLTFTGVGSVVVEADQAGGNGFSAAPPVQSGAVNAQLLSKPVNTPASGVDTVVTFNAAGVLSQVSALTQGAIDLDFRQDQRAHVGAPNCVVSQNYAAGQTCTLRFDFTPTRPGIRYGGFALSDAAGTLLANTYVYGYGVGPQVLYAPVVQTLVGNSLGNPSGVATNAHGDIFVSNYNGSSLTEIDVTGKVIPIGNFSSGKDVAVDGSGNVFIITYDSLYEVQAVNGVIPPAPVIRTLTTGLTVDGGGLAIDGSGNAYIANGPIGSSSAQPLGVVYVVQAVGGVIPDMSARQTVGPMFAQPTGVAVDSAGNVYVSDGEAPGIFEMLAVNGRVPAAPTVLKLGTGYVSPSNIRLDNTNDIFISDTGVPGILEYTAVNGAVPAAATPRLIGSGFSHPQGLLVDDSGNVFVADQDYTQVVKLNYSSVPTLTFAPTLVGSTSADSPQTVTYTNAGNADLIFPPPGLTPGITSNPAITTDFTLASGSTCPQLGPASSPATLPVGQSCTDLVSFKPSRAGPEQGTLTTVDNNLSVAGSTQVIVLNGTGTLLTPVIQFSIADHFVNDPPFTITASSTSPAAISYRVVSGPATLAGTTLTLTGSAGSVTVQAAQAATGIYTAATQSATFAVSKHPQTINFPQPATPVMFAAGPFAVSATASSGLPVTFTILSGVASVRGGVVTFTAPGTIVIAANQPGDAVNAPAPQVTRTVVISAVSITLTASPNVVFLRNPVTLTAVLAPIGGTPTGTVTFLDGGVAIGAASLNGGLQAQLVTSSLTLGNHAITAAYSGDAGFAGAASVPQNVAVQDFSVTFTSPDITIVHGGTATYTLQLTPIGPAGIMPGPVQLTVAGLPGAFKVSLTPQMIAAGNGLTNATLVVVTPNYPVTPVFASTAHQPLTYACLALGLLLLPLRRRTLRIAGRRRSLLSLLLAVSLTLMTLSVTACGSGWRAQQYSFTVTGAAGPLTHTAAATLQSECKDHSTACPVQ